MSHVATTRIHMAVATALLCCAANAQAIDAKRVAVNIQPQPVLGALKELGEQTGLQLLMRVDGASSNAIVVEPVTGELSLKAALDKLLAGTGLTYEFVNERTVRIARPQGRPLTSNTSSEVLGVRLAELTTATDSADGRAESSAVTSQSDAHGGQIQQVIVTASKREERLIDVPQSVTVVSADGLSKTGATQFRDFADTIPGLSFQTSGPGFTQITLRGVSAGSDAGATVGVYVDDVPIGSSTTFARGGQTTLDAALVDLDRIEVLKGPQGTLYGATAEGGIVKYVTKAPDATRFAASVQTGFAGTEYGDPGYNVSGTVNVPLQTDTLALRATGFYTHDGGFIDNVALGQQDINDSKIYGGRADLLFTPTGSLSFRLSGFLQNISSGGFPYADYSLSGVPVSGSLDSSRPVDEPFDSQFRSIAGTVAYQFEPATLTSISSYQSSDTHFLLYSGGTTASLRSFGVGSVAVVDDSGTDKFTQEIRLASRGTQTFEWLVGAFYTHESSFLNQDLQTRNLAGQSIPNTFLTVLIPSIYEETAAFGDLTWHLTDKLDVTGGVRYAHNSTQFAQKGFGSLGRSAPSSNTSDNVFTYLANARYHFTERATGYLRYATGYRPGGPNVLTVNPTTGQPNGPPTFGSDTLRSYEIGYKAQTRDDRFGFDVSAYHIDWNNLIFNVTVAGFASRGNAPDGATVNGSELALYVRPIRDLRIEGTFAYQDATMSEAVPLGLRAAKGERLPAVPRFTAGLSADYAVSHASWEPTVGFTVSHVGDRTASYNASTSIPQYRLPEYTSVDFRAGAMFGSINTQLYVRNAFDERGQLMTRFTSPLAGPMTVSILQPRTVGLNLSMQF